VGHCSTHGRRKIHRILLGKSEGKRPLGRSAYRWEDNIKMGLKEVGCEGVVWIHLAQDDPSYQ